MIPCWSEFRRFFDPRFLTHHRGAATIDTLAAKAAHPGACREHSQSPRRLAWPRTSPFHGGNTGSNPVGDAKSFQELKREQAVLRRHKKEHREQLSNRDALQRPCL